MHAVGRLRHCFYGDYYAIVVLQFESPENASSALGTLGHGWKPSDKNANVIVWQGNSEALEAMQATLGKVEIAPCGFRHCGKKCKAKSIDALTHSIDYGPEFSVDIPPSVPVEQTSLF